MGWVTQEQIERAQKVPAIDYVLKYETGNIRRVGKEYRFLDHESLSIGEKGWYWHSRGIGGFSALSYLTKVRGLDFVLAVCELIKERPQDSSGTKKIEIGTEKAPQNISNTMPFELPARNANNNRLKAYLQSRGIDRDLILDCINRGDLYESRIYHNCVFVGRDETGKAKSAVMRSTGTSFIGNAKGSDKRYGFLLPPYNQDAGEAAVFESPIDALSFMTMCRLGQLPQFDGWHLSLNGTSTSALEHFLKHRAEIARCLICTDNDAAGHNAAAKIKQMPGLVTTRLLPICGGKDWNDALADTRRIERMKGTSRHNTSQCK
jgi:hypothetical protein